MGASLLPVLLVTGFWGVVGVVLPCYLPKGPNRGYVSWFQAFSSKLHSIILIIVLIQNEN